MEIETSINSETILRIKANRLGKIAEVKDFLDDIEQLYNGLYIFDSLNYLPAQRYTDEGKLDSKSKGKGKNKRAKSRKYMIYYLSFVILILIIMNVFKGKVADNLNYVLVLLVLASGIGYTFYEYLERHNEKVALYIIPNNSIHQDYYDLLVHRFSPKNKGKIEISKISIQSPGFWEFIGSMNPIQQMREFLKDQHERKKDQEYRNEQDRSRGQLEIMIKENEVIKQRIEMLKSLGYNDEQIRPLIITFIVTPLEEVLRHKDSGMIEHSEES